MALSIKLFLGLLIMEQLCLSTQAVPASPAQRGLGWNTNLCAEPLQEREFLHQLQSQTQVHCTNQLWWCCQAEDQWDTASPQILISASDRQLRVPFDWPDSQVPEDLRNFALFFTCLNQHGFRLVAVKQRVQLPG